MRAPRARTPQRGFTLVEVLLSVAILAGMMALGWRTIASSSDTRKTVTAFEDRNHELRMAMARMVNDFESAYLSRNEDMTQQNPRTMMIAKTSSKVPDVRFSTLNHRLLWADANESEQTVIEYMPYRDADDSSATNLIRREQRRESNQPPDSEPADYDILVHDVESVKIEFYNWKTTEWQDFWNTTQADGQRGMLPTRVRITIGIKGLDGNTVKLSTQARILLQETLGFGT